MRKLILVLVGLLFLLGLAGACAAPALAPTPAPPRLALPAVTPTPAPKLPGGEVYTALGRGTPSAPSTLGQPWAAERMIVRNTTMDLKVEGVAQAVDQVKEIAQWLGGYVVASSYQGREEERRATISIRVPSDRHDEAVKAIRELAVEVVSENTSTKDVTEEYVDQESRLRHLEAVEKEYLALLARAEKVEDVLKVQQELSKVREQIESTKGRMQYLERTSATSLIEVRLEQVRPLKADFKASRIEVEEGEEVFFSNQTTGGVAPYGYRWDFGDGATSTEREARHVYRTAGSYSVSLRVTDEKGNTSTEAKADYINVLAQPGWSASNIARAAWGSLSAVARGLATFFIWLGIFAPIWIPLGLIAYLVGRRLRRTGNPRAGGQG